MQMTSLSNIQMNYNLFFKKQLNSEYKDLFEKVREFIILSYHLTIVKGIIYLQKQDDLLKLQQFNKKAIVAKFPQLTQDHLNNLDKVIGGSNIKLITTTQEEQKAKKILIQKKRKQIKLAQKIQQQNIKIPQNNEQKIASIRQRIKKLYEKNGYTQKQTLNKVQMMKFKNLCSSQ